MTPEEALRESEVAFTNVVNQRSAVSDALAVPHYQDVERIWKAMLPFLVPSADLDRLRATIRRWKAGQNGDVSMSEICVALGDRAAEEHAHEWVDATNELVLSGEVCLGCGAIRAAEEGETWRCPSCRDTTAPMGMCQKCGVFGLRYEPGDRATEEPSDLDRLRAVLDKQNAERNRAHEAGEHEYERGVEFIHNDLVAALGDRAAEEGRTDG